MSTLGSYLEAGDILLGVHATNKQQLFEVIGKHLQTAHGVPAETVALSLQRRELAASTALGYGVAIPHARVKELERIRLVYARLALPLDFDGPDGLPVSEVLALLVPAPAMQEHLDVLAHVVSAIANRRFRETLYACQDPIQVKEVFERWPQ